ncbi:2'-5' RNA ligase family protein [Streptomyces sp. NPDC058657]|uniref:2'-5' RNA ligase family protein n=1 Tax=unclassified Streptomyces TaxID=2593676 RepID=UPI003660634F
MVLEITEWQPGDPRFASVPNWPAEAGALVATIQFNLRTSKGRDVYEQVRQWHEHNQAQFSIGYRVPPSAATKRADGVRVIHKLDLYEVSPVLHGAHPMTRSLELKADPGTAELEHKAAEAFGDIDVEGAEPQVGRGAMVALYLPAGVASRVVRADGTAARDLHITLAYLGDADQLPGHPDDLAGVVASALDGAEPLAGAIGGIGRFPDHGDGEPVFVPVDVPGLNALRERIISALARSSLAAAVRTDHGFSPHVTLGYDLPPEIPAVPSLPVAFDTVHVVRGPDATPIRLTGPRVVDSTGLGSGLAQLGKNDLGTRASYEAKTARAAVLEAKSAGRSAYQQHAAYAVENKSARAAVLEAKSRITAHILPGATMPIQPLPASYEETRDRVGTAVRALLATEDGTWTCVEATYPDRAIVSVHREGTAPTTYAVPYDPAGPEISLGAPQPVELTTVVIPDQGPAREASSDETTDSLVVRPAVRALTDATARVHAADDADQLEAVRPTVNGLLAALSAKGLDIDPDGEHDEPPTAPPSPMAGSGIDLWDDDPYDEPHDSALVPSRVPDDEDDEDDEESVRLDPGEVKARLAAIQL